MLGSPHGSPGPPGRTSTSGSFTCTVPEALPLASLALPLNIALPGRLPLPRPEFLPALISPPSSPPPAFVALASTPATEDSPDEAWAATIASAQTVPANVGKPPSLGTTGTVAARTFAVALGGVSKSCAGVVVDERGGSGSGLSASEREPGGSKSEVSVQQLRIISHLDRLRHRLPPRPAAPSSAPSSPSSPAVSFSSHLSPPVLSSNARLSQAAQVPCRSLGCRSVHVQDRSISHRLFS